MLSLVVLCTYTPGYGPSSPQNFVINKAVASSAPAWVDSIFLVSSWLTHVCSTRPSIRFDINEIETIRQRIIDNRECLTYFLSFCLLSNSSSWYNWYCLLQNVGCCICNKHNVSIWLVARLGWVIFPLCAILFFSPMIRRPMGNVLRESWWNIPQLGVRPTL